MEEQIEDWQNFNKDLEQIATLFQQKSSQIILFKKGYYYLGDEDIEKLNFICFKYDKLSISFQQSWNQVYHNPFLEVVIGLQLQEKEIPFEIYY